MLVGRENILIDITFSIWGWSRRLLITKATFFPSETNFLPSLWPTLQTILHPSNFFVDFCNERVKTSRSLSTAAFWSSQSEAQVTYLPLHLLLPSPSFLFYLTFRQSTFQTQFNRFEMESIHRIIQIRQRCKCFKVRSLIKESEETFPTTNQPFCDSPHVILKVKWFRSFVHIFWLRIPRNQLKIALFTVSTCSRFLSLNVTLLF